MSQPEQAPDSAQNETTLIERWVEHGCEDAARELINRFHPKVASIIRQRHGQAEDWADLEQEAFTKIFQNLHRFQPDKPLEHWISRIALNVCREYWRKRSSRKELRRSDLGEAEQRVFDQADLNAEFDEILDSRDAHRLMLLLMEGLDPTDRLIVSMLHTEGYTAPEVADHLGMAKTAVRVRAFRARKKLKKLWKELKAE